MNSTFQGESSVRICMSGSRRALYNLRAKKGRKVDKLILSSIYRTVDVTQPCAIIGSGRNSSNHDVKAVSIN